MRTLILASASSRRKEILKKTGLKFKVARSDYAEDMNIGLEPHKLARVLSAQKAEAVSRRCKNAVIIAADTFIVFKGILLGKPRTKADARRMLAMLGGKTHSVVTGFTVLDADSGKKLSRSVETAVSFKKITSREIEEYIKTGEPLDKAGAYAIQGLGAVFVKKIEGDYFNVMGLPLSALAEGLRKFGIRVL